MKMLHNLCFDLKKISGTAIDDLYELKIRELWADFLIEIWSLLSNLDIGVAKT